MSSYLIECVKVKFYHSFVHYFHNLCQLNMSSRHFHSQKCPVGVTHKASLTIPKRGQHIWANKKTRTTGQLRQILS